jgi:hypothetical protein
MAHVANSAVASWLWAPVFWQTFTCNPKCEDWQTMTLPTRPAAPIPAADSSPATADAAPTEPTADDASRPATRPAPPREIGGRDGLDPTRYGDWEMRGRCIDF